MRSSPTQTQVGVDSCSVLGINQLLGSDKGRGKENHKNHSLIWLCYRLESNGKSRKRQDDDVTVIDDILAILILTHEDFLTIQIVPYIRLTCIYFALKYNIQL